eukprot:403342205
MIDMEEQNTNKPQNQEDQVSYESDTERKAINNNIIIDKSQKSQIMQQTLQEGQQQINNKNISMNNQIEQSSAQPQINNQDLHYNGQNVGEEQKKQLKQNYSQSQINNQSTSSQLHLNLPQNQDLQKMNADSIEDDQNQGRASTSHIQTQLQQQLQSQEPSYINHDTNNYLDAEQIERVHFESTDFNNSPQLNHMQTPNTLAHPLQTSSILNPNNISSQRYSQQIVEDDTTFKTSRDKTEMEERNYNIIINDYNQQNSSNPHYQLVEEDPYQLKSQGNNMNNINNRQSVLTLPPSAVQYNLVKQQSNQDSPQPSIHYESAQQSPKNQQNLRKLNTLNDSKKKQDENDITPKHFNDRQVSNQHKTKDNSLLSSFELAREILNLDLKSLDTVQTVILEKVSRNQDHKEIVEQVDQMFRTCGEQLRSIIDSYAQILQHVREKHNPRELKNEVQIFLSEISNILPQRFIANENLEEDGVSFYDQLQRMQTNSQNNSLYNDIGTKKINTYVGFVLEKWLIQGLVLNLENLINAFKVSVISDPNIHFQLKDKIQDHKDQVRQEELDALEDFLLNDNVDEQEFNQKIQSIQEKLTTYDLQVSSAVDDSQQDNAINEQIKAKISQLKKLIAERIKQQLAKNLFKKPLFGSDSLKIKSSLIDSQESFVPQIDLTPNKKPSNNLLLIQDQLYPNSINGQNNLNSSILTIKPQNREENEQKSLRQIFDFYASLTAIGRQKKQDFDQFLKDHTILNLGQVMRFVVDFQLPIKKDKTIEIFKKSSSSTIDLKFPEFQTFLSSLEKLLNLNQSKLNLIATTQSINSSLSQLNIINQISENKSIKNSNIENQKTISISSLLQLDQPEQIRKKLLTIIQNHNAKQYHNSSVQSEDRSISLTKQSNQVLPTLKSKIAKNGAQNHLIRKNKLMNQIQQLQQLPSIHSHCSQADQQQIITLMNQKQDHNYTVNDQQNGHNLISNTQSPDQNRMDSKERSQYFTLNTLNQLRYNELNRQETDDFEPCNFGFEQDPKKEELSVTRQLTNKQQTSQIFQQLEQQQSQQQQDQQNKKSSRQQSYSVLESQKQSSALQSRLTSVNVSKINSPRVQDQNSSLNVSNLPSISHNNNAYTLLDSNQAQNSVIKVNDIININRERESKSIKTSPYKQQDLIIRNLRIRKPRYSNNNISKLQSNYSQSYQQSQKSGDSPPLRSVSRESKQNPFVKQNIVESPNISQNISMLNQSSITNKMKPLQTSNLKNLYQSRIKQANTKPNSQLNSMNKSELIANIIKDRQSLQNMSVLEQSKLQLNISNQQKRETSLTGAESPSQLMNSSAATIMLAGRKPYNQNSTNQYSSTLSTKNHNQSTIQSQKYGILPTNYNGGGSQLSSIRQLYGQDTHSLIQKYRNKLQNGNGELSRGRQPNNINGHHITAGKINISNLISSQNRVGGNYSSLSQYDRYKKSNVL